MQNDLISRSALLKLFANIKDEHETNNISYNALYEVILQQPTAYDVENVLMDLEEAKVEIGRTEYCKARNWDDNNCGNKDCFECCGEHLIAIVRNGGKE